jgi:hypothetical protein
MGKGASPEQVVRKIQRRTRSRFSAEVSVEQLPEGVFHNPQCQVPVQKPSIKGFRASSLLLQNQMILAHPVLDHVSRVHHEFRRRVESLSNLPDREGLSITSTRNPRYRTMNIRTG